MSKKTKKTVRSASHAPDYATTRRSERNAFIRNHPFLYIIMYLGTFAVGMYLFDLITKLF